ncbi:MAG: 2-amino-4-hydroxy-6-hydroxymethyldihydropteridine diphosphokinase [Vicinamibacterales bacterium]|nr:2-amino-4-hydroxy-6-hydroxymethyldihydropteridine diphosphokinase [Vicinamibacterales bacterium]
MDRVGRQVAVAIGSNVGDRQAHLRFAFARLAALLDELRESTVIETAPVGTPGPQAPYLNAAAVGWSPQPARALLEALLAIERDRGRERPYPNAPRTLDLDLILCGDEIACEAGLIVPHPRFRERAFVLGPLAEIAPDLRDPVTGATVEALRRALAGRTA